MEEFPSYSDYCRVIQTNIDSHFSQKLDRLGRSVRDLVNTLYELQQLEVNFVSLRDNIDFSTPTGRLQFHLLSAFAEFERETMRLRIKAGMRAKKNLGKHVGRQPGARDKKPRSKQGYLKRWARTRRIKPGVWEQSR